MQVLSGYPVCQHGNPCRECGKQGPLYTPYVLRPNMRAWTELRNTVIATTPSGGKVKVMDVAEVEDGVAEQKLISTVSMGHDAIGISIQKQSDANAVKVCRSGQRRK
jgi:multidrug efflux pump subunit AcrB